MDSLFIKISLVLSALTLVMAGYLFFSGRDLAERFAVLESLFTANNSVDSSVIGIPWQADSAVLSIKNSKSSIPLINFQQIAGTVDGIVENRLTVSTLVPAAFDINSPALPTMEKRTFSINISGATILKVISYSDPEKAVPLSGLSEIKIGDEVMVTAAGDLINKSVFTAKEIILIRE